MKKLKKGGFILRPLLAIVFILVISSSPSYAVSRNQGKITVIREEYEYDMDLYVYRIFDLVSSGEGDNKSISYKITDAYFEGSEEFFESETGSKYLIDEAREGLNQIIMPDGQKKYINITDDNVEDFANDAVGYLPYNKDGIVFRMGKVPNKIFNVNKLGYYLLYPTANDQLKEGYNTTGILVNVDPEAVVYLKSERPKGKKVADKDSADLGEPIKYTLTSIVPDTTAFKLSNSYNYFFEDELGQGLSLDKESIKVYIDQEEISENFYVIYPDETDGGKLEVHIHARKFQNKIGKEIKVSYEASINKDLFQKEDGSEMEGNKRKGEVINKAKLKYDSDPFYGKLSETNIGEAKVYTRSIEIIKYDGDKKDKSLAGAKFILMNEEGKYYHRSADENKVTWINDEKQATTVVSNKDGLARFEGLAFGKYRIKETQAPDGFKKINEEIDVELDITSDDYTKIAVYNKGGIQLPGTGGSGVGIFKVLGGLLVALTGYRLIKIKKQKKVREIN